MDGRSHAPPCKPPLGPFEFGILRHRIDRRRYHLRFSAEIASAFLEARRHPAPLETIWAWAAPRASPLAHQALRSSFRSVSALPVPTSFRGLCIIPMPAPNPSNPESSPPWQSPLWSPNPLSQTDNIGNLEWPIGDCRRR